MAQEELGKELQQVELFTDGACSGNPGPGGWGVILRCRGRSKELSGGDPETTNNRMELTAAIEGLSALKTPCNVTIYSDSQYLINAFELGWLANWQRSGWRNASKQPVKNADLWQRLIELTGIHRVEFVWVRGHNGHPENERCDYLATSYIKDLSDAPPSAED